MLDTSLSFSIAQEVRQQYEAHPFPDYKLLIPIRRQEAYASTAIFAAQLLREQGLVPALDRHPDARILIAGCGDTFPSLLARWEPRNHRIDAIDLSERNISRARFRVALGLRTMQFSRGAIEESPWLQEARYAHIDAYGVVHHTANPSAVLARLAQGMLPGGSLRLMVYNSPARQWIQHLQHSFQLLGIDRNRREDLGLVRRFLELFAQEIPALKARLLPLKSSILDHDSRLVDTFLHAREAKLSLAFWWEALEAAGLRPISLFDRYAELDDLASPLYILPKLSELEVRAADGRFENNLELFCVKMGPREAASGSRQPLTLPWGLYRCGPPAFWSIFAETSQLGFPIKMQLWTSFRRRVAKQKPMNLDLKVKDLPPSATRRLCRIGAIWPSSLSEGSLRESLMEKIHESMDLPEHVPARDLSYIPELATLLDRTLLAKGRSARYRSLILKRWDAAQNS